MEKTRATSLLVACVLAAASAGCANLTTYNRSIDLKDGSVSIDVKQRVVFSQKVSGRSGEQTVVCAEPSPDALTVLGASGSLSLSMLEKAGNAGAGFAESGAFVGLRTQSIQLLRDAMYRLCEGYAGGAITPSDYAAMQRRYQSTMMGLIAIEQLTRPVIAGQALLTSAASAQAGASAGDPAVDKAQEGVSAATESQLNARTEVDRAAARQEKAARDLGALQTKLAEERARKKPDEAAIAALADKQPAAEQEASDAQLALADARRREQASDSQVRRASASLRDAQTRVATSASGGGALGAVATSSAASTEFLTKGVVEIVSEINRSYTKDTCITLMVELSKPEVANAASSGPKVRSDATQQKVNDALDQSLGVCTKILAEVAAEQKRVDDAGKMKR